EMDFDAGVSGTGDLTLKQKTAANNIELGGSGLPEKSDVLQLSSDDLAQLEDGFHSITIGDDTMTGDITVVGETTVKDDLALNAGTGDIHIEDVLTSTEEDGVVALKTSGAGVIDQTADGVVTADNLVVQSDAAVDLG